MKPACRRAAGAAVLAFVATCLLAVNASAQTTPVSFALDFRALGRHAAWYVALDKGYYKRAGLDVTIIASQGTAQAIQSLESGVVQFAFSDVAGLVAARANHASTAKMVAVVYQKAPYAIFSLRSGANVTRPEQLEGLEIASGAGSFTQKVIEAFMADKGLKPSSAKFVNIDPAARVGMLVSKKVAAIETFVMSQPGVVKAAEPNDAQTFLLADYGLKLYSNGILVRDEYLNGNPAQVKAFVQASLEGWVDTITNPAEAAEIISKYVKGLDRDVVLQEIAIVNGLVATPDTHAKGLGLIDPSVMQASVDLIARNLPGGATVTAADAYDAGYLPQPVIKP
jgi:NitT/TauT family transport system substrate-binding protein